MNAKIKTRRFARTAIAAVLAATALAAVPTANAGAATKFGAKLDPTVQPSNSLPRHPCTHQDPGLSCTMVENSAYYRPDGGERAPKTGTIRRIRLVAGGPGSFRLQIAKVKRSTLFGTNEAKVLRNGPVSTTRVRASRTGTPTTTTSSRSRSPSRSSGASTWR